MRLLHDFTILTAEIYHDKSFEIISSSLFYIIKLHSEEQKETCVSITAHN